MKYTRVITHFYGNPLAIEPAKFRVLSAFFGRLARGKKPKRDAIDAAVGQRRAGGYSVAGRIAVIPIFGAISQRISAVEESSGGVSTEKIGGMIDAALADLTVKKILLQIDSPGGSVYGVQELAAKIRDAGASKKIVAFADPCAASAAYWLASAASEIFITPSGMAGSIGVIMEHCDESAAMEAAGMKTTVITAGEYKAEGHPDSPLTDDARKHLQAIVDTYYDSFVKGVAAGRGVTETKVRDGFGKGRMMTSTEAKSAGLVDGVRTLESVLKYMGASEATSRAAVAARARAVEVSADADWDAAR